MPYNNLTPHETVIYHGCVAVMHHCISLNAVVTGLIAVQLNGTDLRRSCVTSTVHWSNAMGTLRLMSPKGEETFKGDMRRSVFR